MAKEEKNKPIGCKVLHFPKQAGAVLICMYCGTVIKPTRK